MVCFGLGILLTVMGCLQLALAQVKMFVVYYTMSNLCSLCSSLFIVGPGRQCKNMFKEKRRICTLVYLGCMGGTVFLALFCKAPISMLALPCAACQFLAMWYYILSYIPFGRAGATKLAKAVVGNAMK